MISNYDRVAKTCSSKENIVLISGCIHYAWVRGGGVEEGRRGGGEGDRVGGWEFKQILQSLFRKTFLKNRHEKFFVQIDIH